MVKTNISVPCSVSIWLNEWMNNSLRREPANGGRLGVGGERKKKRAGGVGFRILFIENEYDNLRQLYYL